MNFRVQFLVGLCCIYTLILGEQSCTQIPGVGTEGSCYILVNSPDNFTSAIDNCNALGAQLYTPDNETSYSVLVGCDSVSQLNPFWLGATDTPLHTWQWDDGSALDNYTNWMHSAAPSINDSLHCVTHSNIPGGTDLKWIELQCNVTGAIMPVCQYPLPNVSTETDCNQRNSTYFDEENAVCFNLKVLDLAIDRSTWWDNQIECHNQNMTMLKIQSENQTQRLNEWLKYLNKTYNGVWIGLHSAELQLLNRTALSFTKTATIEATDTQWVPTTSVPTCLLNIISETEESPKNSWILTDCGRMFNYICVSEIMTTVGTTIHSTVTPTTEVMVHTTSPSHSVTTEPPSAVPGTTSAMKNVTVSTFALLTTELLSTSPSVNPITNGSISSTFNFTTASSENISTVVSPTQYQTGPSFEQTITWYTNSLSSNASAQFKPTASQAATTNNSAGNTSNILTVSSTMSSLLNLTTTTTSATTTSSQVLVSASQSMQSSMMASSIQSSPLALLTSTMKDLTSDYSSSPTVYDSSHGASQSNTSSSELSTSSIFQTRTLPSTSNQASEGVTPSTMNIFNTSNLFSDHTAATSESNITSSSTSTQSMASVTDHSYTLGVSSGVSDMTYKPGTTSAASQTNATGLTTFLTVTAAISSTVSSSHVVPTSENGGTTAATQANTTGLTSQTPITAVTSSTVSNPNLVSTSEDGQTTTASRNSSSTMASVSLETNTADHQPSESTSGSVTATSNINMSSTSVSSPSTMTLSLESTANLSSSSSAVSSFTGSTTSAAIHSSESTVNSPEPSISVSIDTTKVQTATTLIPGNNRLFGGEFPVYGIVLLAVLPALIIILLIIIICKFCRATGRSDENSTTGLYPKNQSESTYGGDSIYPMGSVFQPSTKTTKKTKAHVTNGFPYYVTGKLSKVIGKPWEWTQTIVEQDRDRDGELQTGEAIVTVDSNYNGYVRPIVTQNAEELASSLPITEEKDLPMTSYDEPVYSRPIPKNQRSKETTGTVSPDTARKDRAQSVVDDTRFKVSIVLSDDDVLVPNGDVSHTGATVF